MQRGMVSIQRACAVGVRSSVAASCLESYVPGYAYTYSYTYAVRGRFTSLSFGDAMLA